jgi:hypothetical protein
MTTLLIDDLARLDASTLESYRLQVERLPVTMRPSLNKQLSTWDDLFPYERNRLTGFFAGIASFAPSALDSLTQPLRAIEAEMDLAHTGFSVDADTMQNASLLARSPYYAEWRREVQRVFSAIEAAARAASPAALDKGHLIFVVLPESLPITSIAAQKPWDPRALEFRIDGDPRAISDLVLRGDKGLPAQLAHETADGIGSASANCWRIDAGAGWVNNDDSSMTTPTTLLEFATLKRFRDEFLAQVNTVPKDIAATDQVLDRMRHADWSGWWPPSLAGQERLRSFVVELFLSGNGALIFSNAFVQWAASEALRRARPRFLAARFGVRSKPKPFTSIAIFENQQKISALHDEDDPQGSAADALILARYIWLSAMRYPEREHTGCVCVAESSRSFLIIAPDGQRPNWSAATPVQPEDVVAWMRTALLGPAARAT